MKLNRTGVKFCIAYVVIVVFLFVFAGRFASAYVVFLPIGLLLVSPSVAKLAETYRFLLDNAFVFFLLNLMFWYFMGWAISSANAAMPRLFTKPAPVPSSDDPYGIPKQ